jgi:hypothetical protein
VPTTPAGTRPAGEDAAAKAAQGTYDKQLADFNAYKADPAAFNETMRKYGLDQKSYDTYKTDYQNRLQNTPMYIQSQFDTGNKAGEAKSAVEQPFPMPRFTNEGKQSFSSNELPPGFPTRRPSGITGGFTPMPVMDSDNPLGSQVSTNMGGISNRGQYDTTGSYYGNQLKSPTYGAMPASMINATPQEKSDYYLQQRNLGYNNADLRTASENTFGKVNEGDWAQMTAGAYPTYNQNIVDAYKSIGRSWDAGTIDAPGYNYWMNQVSSGAFNPKDLNSTFAQIAANEKAPVKAYTGGSVNELAAKYAQGGGVSSPGQVAAYYKQRSRDGYTDSEIRAASDNIFGTSSDADWQYIKTIANVNPAPTMSSTGAGPINIAGTSGSYGGSDPYVDPNPAWTNLSNEGKAAYFAANPIEANLNALAIYGFKNTPLGAIQNYFDPKLQQQLLTNLSSNFAPVESRGTALASVDTGVLQGQDAIDAEAAAADAAGVAAANESVVSGMNAAVGDAAVAGTAGDVADSVGDSDFAHGGRIKTHYQTAGAVRLPSGYENLDDEAEALRYFSPSPDVVASPVNMVSSPMPVNIEPQAPVPATVIGDAPKSRSILTKIANVKDASLDANAVNAMNEAAGTLSVPVDSVAPVAVAPKAAMPLGGERMATMQAMLAAYGPKDGAYDAELKLARARATADSDAFTKMLTTSMKSPEDAQSSKAEMYFRLAAAFGAPTKTGQFSENLGMVGKELGEYAKGKRASAREKQLLGLEVQKLKMASSKEDLNTLRALAGKEMDDKRAIATELIKDYIKSGEPQSAAGKQALDEGLVRGTPEYQARVEAIGNLNIEGKLAQINASLAGVGTAAATLALAKDKFEQAKNQQSKLTAPEMKLKIEAEDTLAQTEQALANLKKAYALNPNTFDGSFLDVAQRKLYESSGSKDPKVVATRELENLLKKASLSQLKATFPGAISNDERAALDAVQGLDAKSKDERAVIMKNAFTALKSVSIRHRKRLDEVNRGVYRDTGPIEGGTD